MSSWPLIYVSIVLVIFNLYSTCPGDLKSISLLSGRPLIYILLVLEIFNLFSSCSVDVKSTGCPKKHGSCWIVLNIFFHYNYRHFADYFLWKIFYSSLTSKSILIEYDCNILFCFILVGIKQLNKLWKKSCSKCLTPINPFRPVSIQVQLNSHEYHSQYHSGYDSVCIFRYLSYKIQLNAILQVSPWFISINTDTTQVHFAMIIEVYKLVSSMILYYQCQPGHKVICINSQSSSIFQESDSGRFLFANQEVITLTL